MLLISLSIMGIAVNKLYLTPLITLQNNSTYWTDVSIWTQENIERCIKHGYTDHFYIIIFYNNLYFLVSYRTDNNKYIAYNYSQLTTTPPFANSIPLWNICNFTNIHH